MWVRLHCVWGQVTLCVGSGYTVCGSVYIVCGSGYAVCGVRLHCVLGQVTLCVGSGSTMYGVRFHCMWGYTVNGTFDVQDINVNLRSIDVGFPNQLTTWPLGTNLTWCHLASGQAKRQGFMGFFFLY